MNKLSEDEAIEIILDNKKEYERIIKELNDVQDTNGNKPIETIQDCQKFVQAIDTILDLYQKEKEWTQKIIKAEKFYRELYNDVVKKTNERYIPKDKIREKIKELEGQEDWYIENKSLDDLYGRIDELKELLGE